MQLAQYVLLSAEYTEEDEQCHREQECVSDLRVNHQPQVADPKLLFSRCV